MEALALLVPRRAIMVKSPPFTHAKKITPSHPQKPPCQSSQPRREHAGRPRRVVGVSSTANNIVARAIDSRSWRAFSLCSGQAGQKRLASSPLFVIFGGRAYPRGAGEPVSERQISRRGASRFRPHDRNNNDSLPRHLQPKINRAGKMQQQSGAGRVSRDLMRAGMGRCRKQNNFGDTLARRRLWSCCSLS